MFPVLQVSSAHLSPPQRPLCATGDWGEGERKGAGDDARAHLFLFLFLFFHFLLKYRWKLCGGERALTTTDYILSGTFQLQPARCFPRRYFPPTPITIFTRSIPIAYFPLLLWLYNLSYDPSGPAHAIL